MGRGPAPIGGAGNLACSRLSGGRVASCASPSTSEPPAQSRRQPRMAAPRWQLPTFVSRDRLLEVQFQRFLQIGERLSLHPPHALVVLLYSFERHPMIIGVPRSEE